MTTAASSCTNCRRDGIVSTDQDRHDARGNPGLALRGRTRGRTRFHCPACRREWVTTDDTELHGRFLDRAGLR